jgi:hypothetical protein
MIAKKKQKLLPFSALFLLLSIAGFSASVCAEYHFDRKTCAHIQSMNVGILNVWHDDTSLYVAYNAANDEALGIPHSCEIIETRLAIGGVRHPEYGSVSSDQFPFQEVHDGPVQTYTYVIQFDEWDEVPGEFYIAAQAVLVPAKPSETHWGDNSEFCDTEFEWATYFTYTLNPPEVKNNGEPPAAKEVREKGSRKSQFPKLANYYYSGE